MDDDGIAERDVGGHPGREACEGLWRDGDGSLGTMEKAGRCWSGGEVAW